MRRITRFVFALLAVIGLLRPVAVVAQDHADKSDPSDPLATGISLQTAKKYDDAIAFFDQVATSKASDTVRARALARKGFVLVSKGDRANARRTYLDLVDLFPKESDHACAALKNTGELFAMDKDYPNAIVAFQRAVDNYGKEPNARKYAAEAQNRIGMARLAFHDPALSGKRDIRKAAEAFQRVVDGFPEQTEWVAEAKMQLVALKLEFAINRLATYGSVQTLADEFLTAYPDDEKRAPTVRMVRAEALAHLRLYSDAIAEIGIIQKQYANSGQPAGTSQFLLAQCYDRKGDYARAIKEYGIFLDTVTKSFSAWEERPAAQFGISTCLQALGRTDEAAAALAKLRSDYPNSYFTRLSISADDASSTAN